MTDITWGDPIPVDGKRPHWLRDGEGATAWNASKRRTDPKGDLEGYYWSEIQDIAVPADHPYYAVQRHNAQNGTNFTYWPGGENAPDDWDGGSVLIGSDGGNALVLGQAHSCNWSGMESYALIIGYTRRAEPLAATDSPAQWAIDRAIDFITDESTNRTVNAFARYIEQHEQPPVDRDVLAVREILAQYTLHFDESYVTDEMYVKGLCDDTTWFQSALAVYRKHRQ